MKSISIREIPDEEYELLKVLAAFNREKLEPMLRIVLQAQLEQLRIHPAYIIRAIGPGPSFAEVRRTEDSISDPRNILMLSAAQKAAFEQAIQHVKSNQRGDYERAIIALRDAFEHVIPTLLEE